MTYMRIYWKRKPDALKKLIEKYAENKNVTQIGYDGWEILVNSKEIVKEIKKYCQYRNKNVTIDKIEEIKEDEIEKMEEIEEMEEGIPVTDELYHKMEEEINETEIDEADELVTEMELEQANKFSKWQDFYSEISEEKLIMDLYQYPEFRCACNPVDGCDCEENYYRIIYGHSCVSNKRLEMQKMMDKYY